MKEKKNTRERILLFYYFTIYSPKFLHFMFIRFYLYIKLQFIILVQYNNRNAIKIDINAIYYNYDIIVAISKNMKWLILSHHVYNNNAL